MKLIPIRYKIALNGNAGRTLARVRGYAIDSPYRLCIRQVCYMWQCDDYDTGCKIGPYADSKEECVEYAINCVAANIKTGLYAEVQQKVLAQLKSAGLL